MISAYESGHRQPSVPALVRLVEATGYELTLDISWPPEHLARLSGPLGGRVQSHRRELTEAAAAHGVSNLRVFGSVARGEDRADSDLDLLVDLPPGMGLFALGRVQAALETIIGARVDLVAAADLKPGVRAQVERDLVPL